MRFYVTMRLTLALLVLVVFGYGLIQSFAFATRAQYFPLVVATAGILAGIALLALDVVRWRKGDLPQLLLRSGGPSSVIDDDEDVDDLDPEVVRERAGAKARSELGYALWIAAFVGLVALLGLLPASAVFVVAFLRREAGMSWIWITVATATLIASAFALVELLSLQLPSALLLP